MSQEWETAINRWARMNERHHTDLEGKVAPDRNDEYLLYQTLIGVWPLYKLNETEHAGFTERIRSYMIKAIREAKLNTSWLNPNQLYESAVLDFVANVLRRTRTNLFLADFEQFQASTAHFGMFNSLSQTLLKITSPGVPDFYQGNEVWDLSLVDPDNRRPVNYDLRARLLAGLPEPASSEPDLVKQLLSTKMDGRIKLYLTTMALRFRNDNRALFERGNYQPLSVIGSKEEHVCAFSRNLEGKSIIILAPRLFYRLTEGKLEDPVDTPYWKDNFIVVSGMSEDSRYRNVFTGEIIESLAGEDMATRLPLDKVLAYFPVALLEKLGSK
jgi:(1->4)-alpha-D-glucan 1-alpha-D-glucosylmutase